MADLDGSDSFIGHRVSEAYRQAAFALDQLRDTRVTPARIAYLVDMARENYLCLDKLGERGLTYFLEGIARSAGYTFKAEEPVQGNCLSRGRN
ncbi:hypothetical protein JXB11_03165 [Candidatus Woesearchaeota archaeon]|nr:hypothetical protein [Candidatus Woesearchaeota archaeon]